MLATRFKTKLGKPGDGGDWNPDTATSHIYRDGRTLCGRLIGRGIDRGGRWEVSNWPESGATCQLCLRRRRAERD